MPSLNQLLAAHAPILLIDAASASLQVGWINGPAGGDRWATSNEEAGVGVFRCLEELGAKPEAAGCFVYCDGPGSILGIRTVAMALRAWSVRASRPIYAYHSLALVAHGLGDPAATVIADARRELWHAQSLATALRRCPASELAGPLVTPAGFRSWAPLPEAVKIVPYALAAMLPKVTDVDLFNSVSEPDAFLHEEPSYVTWDRQIHRAK